MKYKILLFHYVGGAGAKFIANCLSMSGQVAFSNFEIAKQFIDTNDFEIIKKSLLDTIPPKAESRTWLNREQGCWQLFGEDIANIRNYRPLTNKLNDLSVLGEIWLPLMSHKRSCVEAFLEYFSDHDVKTILVEGTKEFIDRSIKLKWPEKHHCLDLDIYNKFHNDLAKIHFDHEIRDWNPLEPHNWSKIVDLARFLQIDFDIEHAKFYIEKYVDFYS
jgi:hypothetical protein